MNKIDFISILKAEHYKARGNFAVLLMLLYPLTILLIVDIYIIYESKGSDMFGYNPWVYILGRYTFNFFVFLYPMITSILCYSLCEIESKNNNYKQLFTLPVNKLSLFLAKIIYLIEIILLSVLIAYIFFLISGYCFSYILPELTFQDYDARGIIFIVFCKIFLSLLAIASIQYCLSLTFKSFVIPISIGCFITIFTLLVCSKWDYNYLIPYYSINNASISFSHEVDILGMEHYYNIIFYIVFMIIGYFLFKRK